jgi:hypothetical protein
MTSPAIHSISAPRSRIRELGTVLASNAFLSVAAIAIACSVMAWLRIPPIARDTLWAEDGRNFLQDAVDHGPIASLVIPYAGYLHTIPRILASITVTFAPVAGWADAMTAGACVVAGLLAAIVYVCCRDVVPWLPARILVACFTVLAPLAPREVLGNAANLHSLVLWTMLWLLLYTPRTRTGAILLGSVALLGAATEIQCLLLSPLVLLLLRWRNRRRRPVIVGFGAGLVLQLVVTLLWPRPPSGHPPVEPLSIAYGYLINAAMPLATPQDSIGPVLAGSGPLVGLLVFAVVAGAFTYVLVRGGTHQRIAACGLLAGSLAVYSASVVSNPNTFYDYARFDRDELAQVWLARYGVVPSMMLAAIVVLATALAVARRSSGGARRTLGERRRIAGTVALAVVAALLLAQFIPQFTRRSAGPEWSPQVTAAARSCERLPDDYVFHLRETITWHVWLSCRILDTPGS